MSIFGTVDDSHRRHRNVPDADCPPAASDTHVLSWCPFLQIGGPPRERDNQIGGQNRLAIFVGPEGRCLYGRPRTAAVVEPVDGGASCSQIRDECVLLSYWFYETFAPDRQRQAPARLERAVKADPGYSLGWSRLAFSYIETKKYAIDTPEDWAGLSREAANRAIEFKSRAILLEQFEP